MGQCFCSKFFTKWTIFHFQSKYGPPSIVKYRTLPYENGSFKKKVGKWPNGPSEFTEALMGYYRTLIRAIFLFVSVVAWIVYMVEGCVRNTLSYVENMMNTEQAHETITEARKGYPTIEWYIDTYHDETSTKTVTR